MSTRYVELHIIQNFAPSCLNRDDTNTPKDCEFGGVRRARISSQCLKRAIRTDFPNYLEPDDLGVRTRQYRALFKDRLREAGKSEDEVQTVLDAFVPALVSGLTGGTDNVIFIGGDEIAAISDKLIAEWDEISKTAKKGVKGKGDNKTVKELPDKVMKGYLDLLAERSKSVDVALFGRMMAQMPKTNQEASCQVAHAISTHAVAMDWDFYTAVDDLNPEEESGAGMMGVIGYNSSCFYRYSVLDVRELASNLHGDEGLTKRAIDAYIRAAIDAVPSAKQNSFAAHNPPSFVFAVVREHGRPASLTNAFEKPANATHRQSLVENSLERLDGYWGKLTEVYGRGGIASSAFFAVNETDFDNFGEEKKVTGKDKLVEEVIGNIDLAEVEG